MGRSEHQARVRAMVDAPNEAAFADLEWELLCSRIYRDQPRPVQGFAVEEETPFTEADEEELRDFSMVIAMLTMM
jgi:hypothetical protein